MRTGAGGWVGGRLLCSAERVLEAGSADGCVVNACPGWCRMGEVVLLKCASAQSLSRCLGFPVCKRVRGAGSGDSCVAREAEAGLGRDGRVVGAEPVPGCVVQNGPKLKRVKQNGCAENRCAMRAPLGEAVVQNGCARAELQNGWVGV